MPPAARLGDMTNHPGVITGPGNPSVLIQGQPACSLGDGHTCSFPGLPPHPPTVVVSGSSTVLIGGRPAARVGDLTGCGATIVTGAWQVLIGG